MSKLIDRDSTVAAGSGVAVTPDDTTDLTYVSRAIWCGVAGNVTVILDRDASAITLVGVPAGALLPIRARRVMSTGTTAGSLVSLR